MSTHNTPLPQAPAAAASDGPFPGYSSPIPIVRTHLGHALASEWTKIRSVRSTIWTLGVFALLVFGIGLLVALAVRGTSADLSGATALAMGFFGLLLGMVCVITLGVLTTASEYGTGMIRTTMTACPTRGRVLAAKSIVFFVLAFVVTLVTVTVTALVQTSLLTGHGVESPTGQDWLKATVGISLFIALVGLISLLVGSMIRHSAGAITLMIGAVLAPLVIALFMNAPSLEKVQQLLLEYSIPSQMGVFYDNTLSHSGPSGWEPLWIMLGVTAAAYAAAYALLRSRDV
ncbi:ABC transporter permease subunit [Streptomyces sp. SID4985]|uniref:ABC transporter permease n=1 Tax=Streptomyces sp. SID4985 TaxID=2690292 RepID=UPI00136C38ED|nr:ABC transporter permease [Streptomyces sp. SID4985]MYQ46987.1 ABC transporter permease subunit [Streptomyces sp. SID4985]